MQKIPAAASATCLLLTPWTAQRTNGKAICNSRKSFQASGQSKGVSGTRPAAESASSSDFDSDRTSVYAAGMTHQKTTLWMISKVRGSG